MWYILPRKDDPLIKTSVSIRQSQKAWAEANHINVSSVIREVLDNMMKKVKYL